MTNTTPIPEDYLHHLGSGARDAATAVAAADTSTKNNALLEIAQAIDSRREQLLQANATDVTRGQAEGLEAALLDRLHLDDHRLDQMIAGLQQVAALPDPCGELGPMHYQPSGIQVGKMRVPLGVIAIIYESRPNVTIDAASLCLKSGNAAILRGGKEALASNQSIAQCIQQGLVRAHLPKTVVQVVETTDRAVVGGLITLSHCVDVIVPRGGKGLIERIAREATVPVIKHLDGICHVYIDDEAHLQRAHEIAINAKTHRYGVCNAMETLLVAESIAPALLPDLCAQYTELGVELRGCERSRALVSMATAAESDWSTEYLAPILSIKVVSDMAEAMEHIARFGSQHTDAIITQNISRARRFITQVDSSSVVVNASTRFADGFEYGLGAEIGISTNKLHARGPVGLQGLTTEKWVVFGDGHCRQ